MADVFASIRSSLNALSDEVDATGTPYQQTVLRVFSLIEFSAEAIVARDGRLSPERRRQLAMAKACIEQGDPEACRSHILTAIRP